jgi:hypothetical protein
VTSLPFGGAPPTVGLPVVPRRAVPLVEGDADVTMTRSRGPVRPVAASGSGMMRVGVVPLDSAVRYLLAWAVGICCVLVVVLVLGYALLSVLGVVGSVSRGLAVLLGQDVPSSGVLPVLQATRVLPAIVLLSVVVSGLWLVAAFGAVLVHNAVTSVTGGLRVRIRPDSVLKPLPPVRSRT